MLKANRLSFFAEMPGSSPQAEVRRVIESRSELVTSPNPEDSMRDMRSEAERQMQSLKNSLGNLLQPEEADGVAADVNEESRDCEEAVRMIEDNAESQRANLVENLAAKVNEVQGGSDQQVLLERFENSEVGARLSGALPNFFANGISSFHQRANGGLIMRNNEGEVGASRNL